MLVIASTFPSVLQPIHGVFVKERLRFVAGLPDFDLRVISPTPYFPPLKMFPRWYPLSQVPKADVVDGLDVVRPRYFLPPKVGALMHPQLMVAGAARAVARAHRQFDFELIDAHFIYADGVAAVMFARKYGKPVVLTGRGEEILRFPSLPVIGKQIRWALKYATRLVALSQEIADSMASNGADEKRITVIENGVDTEKFRPVPQAEARKTLGLPQDRPILVSVGYRLERKGFHLLIDCIPELKKRWPNLLVAIVGGPARWGEDYTPVIEERIRTHGVEDSVHLAGPRKQEELSTWYSAADLFVLLTSREGSPNVLMEALACGAPAVATPIGGIPDVLADRSLGIVLRDRSVEAATEGISVAMEKAWDRGAIRRAMEARSWQTTAERVREVFNSALAEVPGR